LGCTQIVAGGERVARVQADAYAGFVVDLRDDVAEVFEAVADDGAFAGHVFEEGGYGVGGCVSAVEGGGDAGDCGRAG